MHDRLGPVRYRTPDAARLAAFYQQVLGFTLRPSEGPEVRLGTAAADLLILDQDPAAVRPRRAAGLYHTAFLVPSHRDLVHLLGRIAVTRTPVEGFNHHGTHEAIYLPDPDGNGIELAWDLPESQWPRRAGSIDFLAHDLEFDPEAVLAEFQADQEPWPGLPEGTRVGHVHLHVKNLDETKKFYTEVLGMDLMFDWSENGALFLAGGGYHHHVGANLWKGQNLPEAPEGAAGLADFTWKVRAAALPALKGSLETRGLAFTEAPGTLRFKDPSGVGIVIQAF